MKLDKKVNKAYQAHERAVLLVQERLVCTFINGIANNGTYAQVYARRPANLANAYQVAITIDRAKQLAGGRVEEPMELAMFHPQSPPMLVRPIRLASLPPLTHWLPNCRK